MSKLRHLFGIALLSLAAFQLALGGLTSEPVAPKLEPLPVYAATTREIVDALTTKHYLKLELNDQLSSRIFDDYIKALDPTHSYLLQSDINDFEIYRYVLDDSLKRGDVGPAFKIFNRYRERVEVRMEKDIQSLGKGASQFDFTVDESLTLDREDAPWATTEAELDDLWRKQLENSILSLKLTGKADDKIQELLMKRYTNRLSRTKQTNNEDVFQLYMNAYAGTYDPHTQYFSPQTSENFNINMSLSLEGIGAVLQREDEYTKVVSLVPAGPADKSKLLHPDDRIVAVGQGEKGEMVDVIGWRLDEVVQLIRGKKDTVVRLEILAAEDKEAAASKIIQITRNTVKLEEQSAKSEVIEVDQAGGKHKIGVITIPTFYIDFQALQEGDRNFKSTTRDVKRLLLELINQQVEGVVIDLRDNGGGSLQEASSLTGLFIDQGPTVQIRGQSDPVQLLSDLDMQVTYAGPLAVLVNRLSASASEIFAGAIQDYNRGVIIGSQTFGKGTVQSLINLNRGQLKLTQAKFYRISGESTQHQGIIPDILYPESYDTKSIGESSLSDPLPWDKIQPTSYRIKSNVASFIGDLRNHHNQRAIQDPEFEYLRDAVAYRKMKSEEPSISLNEKTRIARKAESDTFWVNLENRRRVAKGLPPIKSLDELEGEDDDGQRLAHAGTGAAGTTPAAIGGAQRNQDQLEGNELAGVLGVGEQPAAGDSTPPPGSAAKEPDALLVESGNILIDLIDISKRKPEGKLAKQGS